MTVTQSIDPTRSLISSGNYFRVALGEYDSRGRVVSFKREEYLWGLQWEWELLQTLQERECQWSQ